MTERPPTPEEPRGVPARRRERYVRARVDAAARAVAAAPREWRHIVVATREALGLQAHLPTSITSRTVHFVRTLLDGVEARYPIEPPIRLGSGGFSIVEESRELVTGHPIILRTPIPPSGEDCEADEVSANRHGRQVSLLEEAWHAERLLAVPRHLRRIPFHPAIPRILVSGEHLAPDGTAEPCDVYDRAPGVSLRRFAEEHGLTRAQLLDTLWHAARGLAHLHRHGFVHGDVKPDNLCVDSWQVVEGNDHTLVRLIDFDTLSTFQEEAAEILLGTRLTGTRSFMPPESFARRLPADPTQVAAMVASKDVYGLGVTLARILASSPSGVSAAYATSQPSRACEDAPPPVKLLPTVPPEVAELVRRMLQPRWQLRPTMPEVVATVTALRAALPRDAREQLLVAKHSGLWAEEAPKRLPPHGDRLGPYRYVHRRAPLPGATRPVAVIEDRAREQLVGIPFTFTDRSAYEEFLAARTRLLHDVNAIRLAHPERFPGTFRDIVREERRGHPPVWVVWIIRPFLERAHRLTDYLARVEPQASVARRLGILADVAESLAVLEEAGYHHPGVSSRTVFFVPEDPSEHHRRARYRQELMGTASIHAIDPDVPDRTMDDLVQLASTIGVLDALPPGDAAALSGIGMLATWRERAALLARLQAARVDVSTP